MSIGKTPKEIVSFIATQKVEVVDLRFMDFPGLWQHFSIPARELTEAQRTAVTAELERLTGKRIRMRVATDASLIGGVTARIGSTVYDGSVRGQLESLERRLGAEG